MLGLFERRGLLSSETVAEMQGWGYRGGFCVHAGERVAAQDSAGRERLLRYCASDVCRGAPGVGGRRGAGTLAAAVGGVATAQTPAA